MLKTSKLISKRIRITKNKKIIHRQKQQGHNKAKESPNVRRTKRKPIKSQSPVISQAIKNYT